MRATRIAERSNATGKRFGNATLNGGNASWFVQTLASVISNAKEVDLRRIILSTATGTVIQSLSFTVHLE